MFVFIYYVIDFTIDLFHLINGRICRFRYNYMCICNMYDDYDYLINLNE